MERGRKSREQDRLAESMRAKQRFQEALLINVQSASEKKGFFPIRRLMANLFKKGPTLRRRQGDS
jgi:hypothetical protein